MREWQNTNSLTSRKYNCGLCGETVASAKGYYSSQPQAFIFVCPHCGDPSFFDQEKQVPGPVPGSKVDHLPDEIGALYLEARNCVSVGANTSAVLTCRKILMHIGVEQKAPTGETFLKYVEYLADKGFVPPNGKSWVDHIRRKGNEANHEIKVMGQQDAVELIAFLEMLLKFIYEFPARVPAVPSKP